LEYRMSWQPTKHEDRIGYKYYKLTIIDKIIENNWFYWICSCECGKTIKLKHCNLFGKRKVRSCGCYHSYPKIDLLNKKIGKLTPFKFIKEGKQNYWQCKCDCGQEIIKKHSYLVNAQYPACEKCLSDKRKQNNSKVGKRSDKNLYKNLYRQYSKSAEQRDLKFELSLEDCKKFFNKRCFYCDTLPQNIIKNSHYEIIWNGIDRIDSSVGYNKENCVTCCTICNFAKRSLSINEFKDHIEKIYTNFINYQKKDSKQLMLFDC